MKLALANRSTQVFLVVLAMLALLINSYFWSHRSVRGSQPAAAFSSSALPTASPTPASSAPPRQQPSGSLTPPPVETPRRAEVPTPEQEAAKAAESRRQFLARYISAGHERTSGAKLVALAVATEDGRRERGIASALANRFKTSGVTLDGAFFTTAFFTDGLFRQCFADATAPIAKLELNRSLDGLVLGRVTSEFVNNPALQDVLTANLTVEIMALPTASSVAGQSWTFTAAGAGFKPADARAMAEERLLKQINADTRMSLHAVLNSN